MFILEPFKTLILRGFLPTADSYKFFFGFSERGVVCWWYIPVVATSGTDPFFWRGSVFCGMIVLHGYVSASLYGVA
jgi:lipid-A-disaccharide synthase-like uncharacterized protein